MWTTDIQYHSWYRVFPNYELIYTSHFCWHFTSLRSISVDYGVFKRQISVDLRGLKVIDLATRNAMHEYY